MGLQFRVKNASLEKSDGSRTVHFIQFDDKNDYGSTSATNNISLPVAVSY